MNSKMVENEWLDGFLENGSHTNIQIFSFILTSPLMTRLRCWWEYVMYSLCDPFSRNPSNHSFSTIFEFIAIAKNRFWWAKRAQTAGIFMRLQAPILKLTKAETFLGHIKWVLEHILRSVLSTSAHWFMIISWHAISRVPVTHSAIRSSGLDHKNHNLGPTCVPPTSAIRP
jgi:hypothetical protein